MHEKIIKFRWIVELLVVMLLAAYGFIFTSFSGRVNNIEVKVENINPMLMQIQSDLSSIKTDLAWLKQYQTNLK